MRRALLVGVLAGAMITAATGPGARAATTIFVDDDCDGSGTGAKSDPYCTISEAEAAASPGDVIRVRRGIYTETVTVDVPNLRIFGAQAGNDPRNGFGPIDAQSILNDSGGGFSLTADNVTIDGFTITSASQLPLAAGIATSSSSSGYRILNNLFRQNTIGLQLASEGTNTTRVARNLFFNNNAAGAGSGTGIFSDQNLDNADIAANRFSDNDNASVILTSAAPGTTVNQNVTINDNRIDNSIVVTDTIDSQIADNVGRKLSGSGVFIGGNDARLDIARNRLTRGTSGIVASSAFGGAPATELNIHRNMIRKMSSRGISIGSNTVDDSSVRANNIRDTALEAIQVLAGSDGNTFDRNVAFSDADPDVRDETTGTGTAGTASTWTDNKCQTSVPDGLCSA